MLYKYVWAFIEIGKYDLLSIHGYVKGSCGGGGGGAAARQEIDGARGGEVPTYPLTYCIPELDNDI